MRTCRSKIVWCQRTRKKQNSSKKIKNYLNAVPRKEGFINVQFKAKHVRSEVIIYRDGPLCTAYTGNTTQQPRFEPVTVLGNPVKDFKITSGGNSNVWWVHWNSYFVPLFRLWPFFIEFIGQPRTGRLLNWSTS